MSLPILLGIAAVLHAVGIVLALHALLSGRTPQGTIAWLISPLLLPYAAVPLYVVFGGRKFRGYVRARRSRNAELQRIVTALEPEETKLRAMAPKATPGGLAALERLARAPLTRGNDARLLIDGAATFDAIFAGIESAWHYVLVQFFVIRHDALGQALKERLIERARAGVAVCVLYDEVGSGALAPAYVAELASASVRVSPFNGRRARRRLYRRFQLNFRNHRKIVVVDCRTAWVGGANVGDEYMGRHPKLSPWRDTQVEISGPAVQRRHPDSGGSRRRSACSSGYRVACAARP